MAVRLSCCRIFSHATPPFGSGGCWGFGFFGSLALAPSAEQQLSDTELEPWVLELFSESLLSSELLPELGLPACLLRRFSPFADRRRLTSPGELRDVDGRRRLPEDERVPGETFLLRQLRRGSGDRCRRLKVEHLGIVGIYLHIIMTSAIKVV